MWSWRPCRWSFRPCSGLDSLVYPVVVVALPAAIGYAVVRHRLFGISMVLTPAAGGGNEHGRARDHLCRWRARRRAAFGVPGGSVPAILVPAALVAFVLLPAYRRLQAMVARAVYGSRGDPLAVLHDLGQHLAQTPPDEVPDRIVRVLRDSLEAVLGGAGRRAGRHVHPRGRAGRDRRVLNGRAV